MRHCVSEIRGDSAHNPSYKYCALHQLLSHFVATDHNQAKPNQSQTQPVHLCLICVSCL
eukprot:m.9551 g.9551  ORF g.9551 m.9551 type:complete len:59 (+) comp3544_c0_seq2:1601-1777(+)